MSAYKPRAWYIRANSADDAMNQMRKNIDYGIMPAGQYSCQLFAEYGNGQNCYEFIKIAG